MVLTDPSCKAAKCPPGKARERYADSGGLYLEVLPDGKKQWCWKYRFRGLPDANSAKKRAAREGREVDHKDLTAPKLLEKRMRLGIYPEVSLAKARAARDAARATLKAGTDPVQANKDRKLAQRIALDTNFEAVARAWFDHWKGPKSPRHAEYVIRRLEADVFPALGKKPIAEITAPQLLAMAKKIESRGALDIARRSWQTCGQIFEYGIAHGVCERNPAKDVKPSVALKPRTKQNFAKVDAKELPELLRKLHAYDGSPYTRFALQLIALTFVRTSELIEATWDEFDLEAAEWRIPAKRMKMRTAHIVPLSTQAVDVLHTLHVHRGRSGLLFPGERDHERPMSNNTILAALKRMGYAGRQPGHGFRGIASTVLHEEGFDHAHIELQLAHLEGDETSRAYNWALYLPQRRKLMQWWGDHLDALRKGAKVIPFKAA